ncbi:MAG: hypothetical protein GEU94_10005 [Micromonosporaceae bacterium]|nr:hypothetical protein [Micromonosporaceae bacterium]
MGRIVLLLFLLNLALVFAAIVDCLGGERKPVRWSRLTWSLFIIFGVVVGPIAWFMYGRPGKRLPAPWDNLAPGPSQPGAIAPDDDPDFLANLSRLEPPHPPEPDDAAPDDKPAAPKPEPDGKAVRDKPNDTDERTNGG